MRFLLIFALLFLSACGAEDALFSLVSDEEHIEIITLGPTLSGVTVLFLNRIV